MRQRGDTIVEVTIAFAIFSLISLTAFTIMNRGLASAQNSLEVSLVRQQIDAQADLLRYVRDASDDTLWKEIRTNLIAAPVTTDDLIDNCPVTMPSNAFAIGINSASIERVVDYQSAKMYSGVMKNDANVNTAYGIWVQAVKAQGAASAPDAYDMHIRACWYSAGRDRPNNLATIVRLYGT
jgi:type II secretory pathway pseudopilin PulG